MPSKIKLYRENPNIALSSSFCPRLNEIVFSVNISYIKRQNYYNSSGKCLLAVKSTCFQGKTESLSKILFSSPSGASAYSGVDCIHCFLFCVAGYYKESPSYLYLALCPDTLIFLLGRGWSPQPKPRETSGEKWSVMNFCDRQTSVQSLCSVRVDGRCNGP